MNTVAVAMNYFTTLEWVLMLSWVVFLFFRLTWENTRNLLGIILSLAFIVGVVAVGVYINNLTGCP